jgi:cell shape-determining protein MreC
MDSEFVNVYIERLMQEITELTKTKMLTETQLKITLAKYNDLQGQFKILVDQNEKLEASLNKKASKQKDENF